MRNIALTLLLAASAALAAGPKTVWDGVYSEAQAARGQKAYTAECSRCHGEDYRGSGNVIMGDKFMQQWREDNLHSMYNILRNTMPRNAPRSLSEAQYLDIIAYMLKLNGFPAGPKELATAESADILLTGKEGPQAVPDFAMVTVTGCLTSIAGDAGSVTMATEPVRSRQPEKSTAEDFAGALLKTPGAKKFTLMGVAYNSAGAVPGHRGEFKGFLIRLPEGDKLNITSMQTSPAACAP